MGYDIPEPYCYDESFATFYSTIDDEHKGLFQGVFACANAPGDAGKLATLVKAVVDHFANEEAMFEKANYSEIVPHKKLHRDFEAQAAALKAPLDQKSIDFVKSWLVNHIKATDFKYKGKL